MKELLLEYLDGKKDAITTIRAISGMFNPDHAITLMALICAITRIEQGDMDKDVFKSIYKLGESDED